MVLGALQPIMRRSHMIALGVIALVAVAGIGYAYFAPKPSTRVDQLAPSALTLKMGAFYDGSPGHSVSGSARILRDEAGALVLRVENYEATAGPDVYFFLTKTARATNEAAVEGDGIRLVVPGGAGDGQATLRGNFNVPLPAGINPDEYAGITVWCDQFNANFGGLEFA